MWFADLSTKTNFQTHSRMEGNFTSDTTYKPFPEAQTEGEFTSQDLPLKNVPPSTVTSDERYQKYQARAEARRTRRTMRQQQRKELGHDDDHYKISYSSGSSDESTIDENFDVVSLIESESENLT